MTYTRENETQSEYILSSKPPQSYTLKLHLPTIHLRPRMIAICIMSTSLPVHFHNRASPRIAAAPPSPGARCCVPAPLPDSAVAAAAAGLGDVDSTVVGLAVLEPVVVDDPVVAVGARVLVADPPELAPVAADPGQTAAVGNVTLALDSSLVSKPSRCLVAAEGV